MKKLLKKLVKIGLVVFVGIVLFFAGALLIPTRQPESPSVYTPTHTLHPTRMLNPTSTPTCTLRPTSTPTKTRPAVMVAGPTEIPFTDTEIDVLTATYAGVKAYCEKFSRVLPNIRSEESKKQYYAFLEIWRVTKSGRDMIAAAYLESGALNSDVDELVVNAYDMMENLLGAFGSCVIITERGDVIPMELFEVVVNTTAVVCREIETNQVWEFLR